MIKALANWDSNADDRGVALRVRKTEGGMADDLELKLVRRPTLVASKTAENGLTRFESLALRSAWD